MKKGLYFWIVMLCSFLGTGCYTLNFYNNVDALNSVPDGEIITASTLFASMDLDGPNKLRRVCPSGVSRLEIQQTLNNGMLHYMTLGFYSPQTVRVWCKNRINQS